MFYGAPYGCPYDDPANYFPVIETTDLGGGLLVSCPEGALPGMDCWWRLILDGMPKSTPQYAPGGAPMQFKGVYSGKNPHAWAVFCQGGFSSMNIDPTIMLAIDAIGAATTLNAELTSIPSIFSFDDGGQFSNWNLTGANRFNNTRPVQGEPTWGGLDLFMSTVGGVHTITLALDGVVQASAVITGNGSFTVVDQGGGIVGTGTLAYTADIPAAAPATLIHDWPAQLRIYYKTTPWIALPTGAPQGIINDNGKSASYSYRSATLPAGTYYLLVHQVDEDFNEGTGLQGGGIEMVIEAVPAAPGKPKIVSNTITGGNSVTVVSVTCPAACTLNIYDSSITGLLDVTSTAATQVVAAPSIVNVALPAIADTFTGPRYILIRAEISAVESQNSDVTTLNYTAGVLALPAPNVPTLSCNSITKTGLSISVPFTLDLASQDAPPGSVSLYIYPVGGSPGVASGVTSVLTPVGLGNTGHLMVGTVAGTVSTPGLYMFVLASETAGGQFSAFSAPVGPFKLTTAAPVDPGIEGWAGN